MSIQQRNLKIVHRKLINLYSIEESWRNRRATALLSEIIAGVTLYFDKALGNNLLYRFERAQYVEQKRENPDKPMSEIYGAEHLLRLFGMSPSSLFFFLFLLPRWLFSSTPAHYAMLNCKKGTLTRYSQLWPFYRIYQYWSWIIKYPQRIYQWYHEVSLHFSSPLLPSSYFHSSPTSLRHRVDERMLISKRYMIKEKSKVFVKEYETTTTQYQNLSRT